jgi:hypothetical protein
MRVQLLNVGCIFITICLKNTCVGSNSSNYGRHWYVVLWSQKSIREIIERIHACRDVATLIPNLRI